jgi:hypothetical protein
MFLPKKNDDVWEVILWETDSIPGIENTARHSASDQVDLEWELHDSMKFSIVLLYEIKYLFLPMKYGE